MLKFPADFYKTEIREGFEVDSTMKSVWAAEMEVLAAIASVCEKYQLPWYAGWGTLLGAVRHNGFIPWDDDIDIWMKRPDYDKLLTILQNELPSGYRVYNSIADNLQNQFWTCVMNSTYISIDDTRLKEFHGCPFIVGVDIFPLDYLPCDEAEADIEVSICNLIRLTVQLIQKNDKSDEDQEDIRLGISEIEKIFNVKLNMGKDMVTQLWDLANRLCKSYSEDESEYLVDYIAYTDNKSILFKKEWYSDVKYVQFEIVELPIPIGYDDILKKLYGDYTVFEKNTQSHDYPLYAKQLKQLRNILAEMENGKDGVEKYIV